MPSVQDDEVSLKLLPGVVSLIVYVPGSTLPENVAVPVFAVVTIENEPGGVPPVLVNANTPLPPIVFFVTVIDPFFVSVNVHDMEPPATSVIELPATTVLPIPSVQDDEDNMKLLPGVVSLIVYVPGSTLPVNDCVPVPAAVVIENEPGGVPPVLVNANTPSPPIAVFVTAI